MELRSHRKLMALVQGSIWGLAAAGISGGLMFPYFAQGGVLSRVAAALFLLIAPVLTGLIGAVTGANQARKDYQDGKLVLGAEEIEQGRKLRPPGKPMWLAPSVYVSLLAPAFTLTSAALVLLVFSGGISRAPFVIIAGLASACSAAVCAWFGSAREAKRYAAHPAAGPSGFNAYVLREHVSGNSLINIIINLGIGYILFHQGPKHPQGLIEAAEFVPEFFVMCAIIGVAVPIGAAVQAGADVLEGRVQPPAKQREKHPGLIKRNTVYLLMAPVFAGVLWGVLSLFGTESLGLWPVLSLKAGIAAVVAGIAASLAATWAASKTAAGRG